MKLRMTAIGTLADVTAKISRLTVDNGTGSLMLDIRYIVSRREEGIKRILPNLLDFIITDGNHLPSNQRDLQPDQCRWKQDGHSEW